MKGLFFTGTDTEVGKTRVTISVARILHQAGEPVRVMKPVATGARQHEDQWVADDTLHLAAAVNLEEDAEALRQITPWVFQAAVAPPVAARLENVELNLQEIAEAVQRQAGSGDILLVEGVGGLLCPLTEQETIADLVSMLDLPMVVVARQSLGTLNHTMMTLEVARGRNLPIAGVVISETSLAEDLAEKTNIEELTKRLDVPLLGTLPYEKLRFNPDRDAAFWKRLAESRPS